MNLKKLNHKGYLALPWALLAITLACSSGSSSPHKLQYPVPTVPTPAPPAVDPPSVVVSAPAPAPAVTKPSTAPVFSAAPPFSLSINENSPLQFQLQVTLPDGSPPQFFYQCPYACPKGIKISASGQVDLTPDYGQAGVYDVQFVVSNLAGEVGLSGVTRIVVVHVNRPPVINSVTVQTDAATPPTQLICAVDKMDPDGDAMVTARSWLVNGVISSSLSGQVLSIRSVKAKDSVVCRVVVTDVAGASVGPVDSAAFVIPNNPPVISSVLVRRTNAGGNTSALEDSSRIRVGDTVGCPVVTSDLDQNPVTRVATTLSSQPDGLVVASKSGDGDLSYTVQTADAHKSLSCAVTVTDSYSNTAATSDTLPVLNSAPVISSVRVAPDSPSAQTVMSGDAVRCIIDYSDPDGDMMFPVVSFFNGGASRGSGVVESQTSKQLVQRYTLKTIKDVASPLDADVHQAQMACSVSISDINGAVSTLSSTSLTVTDRPPTITLDQASAPTLQTLATGQSLSAVRLNGLDLDGDAVSFEKVFDSCAAQNIALQIDVTGLVNSGQIPGATYPQSARDCRVSYRVTAGGAQTSPIDINLQIPNHAPSLSCVNTTQYLKSGSEDIHGNLLLAGQAIGQDTLGNLTPSTVTSCTIVDSDGYGAPLVGGGAAFNVAFVTNACGDLTSALPSAHAAWDPLALSGLKFQTIDATHFNVLGSMGLHTCNASFKISDGALPAGGFDSNVVSMSMVPPIDVTMDPGISLDNSCFLTVTGTPTFSNTFSFFSSPVGNPTDPLVSSLSSTEPGAIGAGQFGVTAQLTEPFLSQNVDGTTFFCDCSASQSPSGSCQSTAPSQPVCAASGGNWTRSDGNGYLLTWNLQAKDAGGSVTNRTLSRKWYVSGTPPGEGSPNSDIKVYPWHPILSYGWDSGKGRQAAPSSTCVKKLDLNGNSVCTGLRASIAAGAEHTCVLHSAGLVQCFGANDKKQLGYAESNGTWLNQSSPVSVQGINGLANFCDCANFPIPSGACIAASSQSSCQIAGGRWVAGTAMMIAAGSRHNCALMTDQTVRCWGSNSFGQLGSGSGVFNQAGSDQAALVLNADGSPLSGVMAVAAGTSHSCALMSDSTLRCWGANNAAQLGFVATEACSAGAARPCATSPSTVLNSDMSAFSGAVSLSAGGDVTCVLLASGGERCFGDGSWGQLGNASDANAVSAVSVVSGPGPNRADLSGIFGLSLGTQTNCAVLSGGAAYCWGNGASGQLGDGLSGLGYYTNVPQQAAYLTGAAQLSVGLAFGCALVNDGSLQCWGDNSRGQLGSGLGAGLSVSKVNVSITPPAGEPSGALALAVGDRHACAVLSTGRVACWGAGDKGQLGGGVFGDANQATMVVGGRFAATQSCPLIYQLNQK